MSEEKKYSHGQCLCQAVKVKAESLGENFGACHCSMCRNWGSGPFLAITGRGGVVLEGENNITVYDSSDWAERAFCSSCGSHLYYRLKQTNQYILSLGLFPEVGENVKFDHQIFIDEKPHYYAFSNETKNMTGEQVFAEFAAQNNPG